MRAVGAGGVRVVRAPCKLRPPSSCFTRGDRHSGGSQQHQSESIRRDNGARVASSGSQPVRALLGIAAEANHRWGSAEAVGASADPECPFVQVGGQQADDCGSQGDDACSRVLVRGFCGRKVCAIYASFKPG